MELDCRVLLRGRPIEGALVTLVPAQFLADTIYPATGVTDRSGCATLTMAPEHLPNPSMTGVQCGLYTVTITHPKKKIPAKYNVDTTLGCQVSLNSEEAVRGLVFKLSR